jgi:hypothetical protein
MTADDIIELVTAMPGVAVVTAGPDNGAPEIAWGDSFFYYDPDGTSDRRLPFATIVTKDYTGFDESSRLDRDGVFRVNIAVGRDGFRELLGYPPAAYAEHRAAVDHSAADVLLPHPVYAIQSWVAVVSPGPRTDDLVRALLRRAHERAARHRAR